MFPVKTGNMTRVDCCRCLISAHKGPVPQFLLVSTRWCVCLLPFTIFPFPVPECPTHTWPIVCWYDLSNADPLRHTHSHTDRSTVCHCITLHSLGHTVHIYSFITMRHFVWRKAPLSSTLGLRPVTLRPGLLRVPGLQPACFTSNRPANKRSSSHRAPGRLSKPINTAETINPQHLNVCYSLLNVHIT